MIGPGVRKSEVKKNSELPAAEEDDVKKPMCQLVAT
jgi:hypothetical protein